MREFSPRWRTIGLLLALTVGPTPAEEPPRRPANRLAGETSPYLLQHAHNPVDWYPWGPEAFEKARETGRPIFLSVGYSACYWCHVMERECFENEAIARKLNERFVCIKVDREERPDVDAVYMAALQAMTGQGGWPMSIFTTPDGRPFYGGTYFPPTPREGVPSFPTVLDGVADAWRDERAEVEKSATRLADAIRRSSRALGVGPEVPLSLDLAVAAQQALAEQYDRDFGGFGFDPDNPQRPKFPEPSNLLFLLDRHRRRPTDPVARSIQRADPRLKGPEPLAMTLGTLDAIARGGIRDHLGGGFHRYSTDRGWNVPHFEKMLYDNAQLASVFLQAYEITDDPRWRNEAGGIFDFVARELTGPDGGFYSTIDAETEGEEGAFYVWKAEEVTALLGDDSELFARVYGLDRPPNFEGERHVLRRPLTPNAQAQALEMSVEELEARLAPLRTRLLESRSKRPRPRRDDKVLTSWNGLMIAALADGYRILDDDRYKQAAEKAADFLLTRHRTPEGRLLRTSRGGDARLAGYLDDYAFLAFGLQRLHTATGEARWLDQARALADRMLTDFQDERGGFYFTARDHEDLLARLKDPYDNALPGGNSVAIETLLALADATGETAYREAAGKALRAFSGTLQRTPTGAPRMLVGLMRYLDDQPTPKPNPAAAAEPPGPAGPKVLDARAEVIGPARPRPGDTLEIALTLTIARGWHLTAPGAGSDRFRPLRVGLAPNAPGSLLDVDYPEGVALAVDSGDGQTTPPRVYQGDLRVNCRLRLPDDLPPGPRTISLQVHYQACDDRACLAPAVRDVPLKLEIERPGGTDPR